MVERRERPANAELERLRELVESQPREREHRFAWVRASIDAGAVAVAMLWRSRGATEILQMSEQCMFHDVGAQ